MNPYIPTLLRLCYAANKIEELRSERREKKPYVRDLTTTKETYLQELKYDLFEIVNRKRHAIHGDYVVRIFQDISERVGFVMNDPNQTNLRKRIMGIKKDVDDIVIDKKYRDVLAKYTGCKSWDELEKDAKKLCERYESGLLDDFGRTFGINNRKGILPIENIIEGDVISLNMSEGASLQLAHIDKNEKGGRFLVKRVEGLKLEQNDILVINTPFIVQNRLFALEVYRAKKLQEPYVCRHTTITFSLIPGAERRRIEWRKQEETIRRAEENRKQREQEEAERKRKLAAKRKADKAQLSLFADETLDQNAHQCPSDITDNSGNSNTFAAMKQTENNMSKGMKNEKKLCVMGSGSMCFDTVIQREYPEGFVKGKKNKFEDRIVMEEIGSNPGNVMCILGYFGWDSYPIGMFDNYPQGLQMKKDFERYHCNTRFVTNTDEGGTNCFSIIHCLDEETGEPTMKHSTRHAPFCGFPRDKGLTVQGKDATLPKFIERLDFLPDVYFYSGNNPGWRDLGKYMRSNGVLVYYEIQSMSEKEFSKYFACMKEADIVKFSDETIPNIDSLRIKEGRLLMDELNDKLVIQTLGAKGARFNLCGKGWVTLPPIVNNNVVDTEGCGDWTTASFINAIGKRGVLKLADMTEAIVKECLEEAQDYASRNVSYMGTKGIIAADKDFHLAKSDYVDTIMAEMDGHIGIKKEKINSLNAIPEKDLKIYDAKDCFIYRSDYECLKGVERVLDKKKDGVSVMSNFYPCKLPYVYNGKELVFNSAEQAYHFFRYREFPLVQWMIMQQKGANDVKSACSGFKYVDSDHEKTRWMYMTLIEELKYLHCKEFRKKLNDLGDIMLVESSDNDDIFGSAIPGDAQKAIAYSKKTGIDLSDKYIGMNGCGRCIMAVRAKFRGWTDKQLREYTPDPDINVWWENSPVYKKLIDGMGKECAQ